MAALLCSDRSLHARRAAADDDHLLGLLLGGHQNGEPRLSAHSGVDGAAKRCRAAVIQAVEALDAGDDLVLLALSGLVHQGCIRNGTTGHGNDIGFSGSQRGLNVLGLLISAQGQDRDMDLAGLLHILGKIGVVPGQQEVVGVHNVLGVRKEAACGDMGNVDLILHHLQERHTVIGSKAVIAAQLGAGNAVLNQQLLPHPGANGIENHNGELGPIGKTSAEFIGAGIELGGQHLAEDQAVTAMDQDHVKAAFQGILRCVGIDGGNALHGRLVQNLRALLAVDGIVHQLALVVSAVIGEAQQLQGCLRAVEMDRVGEMIPEPVILGVEDILMGVDVIIFLINVHILRGNGDVRAAASCLIGIVGHHVIVGIALLAVEQMGPCRCRPNAVLKGYAPDGNGGKHMRILRFHNFAPSVIAQHN